MTSKLLLYCTDCYYTLRALLLNNGFTENSIIVINRMQITLVNDTPIILSSFKPASDWLKKITP